MTMKTRKMRIADESQFLSNYSQFLVQYIKLAFIVSHKRLDYHALPNMLSSRIKGKLLVTEYLEQFLKRSPSWSSTVTYNSYDRFRTIALINAAEDTFRADSIKCCFFHLCQSIYCYVVSQGLQQLHNSDDRRNRKGSSSALQFSFRTRRAC